jgi:prepilin peptidase CpaA
MTNQTYEYALITWLSVAFIAAAASDWRTRTIPNLLNAAIALGAPFYWISQGMMWQEMAFTAGTAFVVFLIFMIPFAVNQMGGGDLKLIGAASLWFPMDQLSRFLFVMACFGAGLTLMFVLHHRHTKQLGKVWTPYGIAISLAGLFVISQRFINHFG